jgi:hypothetical protein
MTSQLPPIRPMRLTFGGRVPDEDIIGRDETADSLWQDLATNSLLISEMRRFGKSTILRLMERRAPRGWLCLRTTVQDARSTADLIDLTLQALLAHATLKERVKRHILALGHQIDDIGINTGVVNLHLSGQPAPGAGQTLRRLLEALDDDLRHDDARLAIMWDEFPDAIDAIRAKEGAAAARDVLALLKASRQNDDSQRLRWVLTGSVGFHHIQRALGGHGQEMADLTARGVGPLTPAWSRWLATALLLGIGREPDPAPARAIAELSGGIPFVAEMMVKYLRDNRRGDPAALPPSPAAARRLLVQAASDPAIGANWTPLLARVEDYYGDLADLAETILDAVARSPLTLAEAVSAVARAAAPADRRQARQVMDLLVDDHYLVFDHDSATYSWRHEPLRVIWRAKRAGP